MCSRYVVLFLNGMLVCLFFCHLGARVQATCEANDTVAGDFYPCCAFPGVCFDAQLSVSMGSAHCPNTEAHSASVHCDPYSACTRTTQPTFECVDYL